MIVSAAVGVQNGLAGPTAHSQVPQQEGESRAAKGRRGAEAAGEDK